MAGRSGFGAVARMVLLTFAVASLSSGSARAQSSLDEVKALNTRVMALLAAGKYAEAIPSAKRALMLGEKALARDHPDVGTLLNNLAELYSAQGRYPEAEPLYQRSLAIREKALGPGHPDVGQSLNNLARLYHAQGRYAEAEPLYRRSLAIREKGRGPHHPEVGQSLSNLAELYSAQGRYAEVESLHKRALAIREKALGPDHPEVATSLNNLAARYFAQGRYVEVEPLLKRSLATREKALGLDHPAVGHSLNNLATLYERQGRYAEAEPLYQRALAITERALGREHQSVSTMFSSLAGLYHTQGRYAEAEPLYQRALAITEKALGPAHPDVGQSLNNLARLYHAQGRYAEAEPPFKRSLAITEKALGPDHPEVGTTLNNLAAMYADQGRYAEAEVLNRRALIIREKALGLDHRDVGGSLNNLALLYWLQGRYAESAPLYQRSHAILEKVLGSDHPEVGKSLNNLAVVYKAQRRYAEAEPLYQRAVSIREKALGPDHPDLGQSINNLALLYVAQSRYDDAEPLLQRSLAIYEKALGLDHPTVGRQLNNLAGLHKYQGRYAEAEPLYQRSLANREKALGPDHPDVGQSLSNLGELYFAQRDWARAADLLRRSTGVAVRRAQRGTTEIDQTLTGKGKSEVEQVNSEFWVFLKATYRLASQERTAEASLTGEMFQTTQWAQSSEAAQSLAQMAARGARGDPQLAVLVRERQDLVGEWQKRDAVRIHAVSQAPDKRDRAAEVVNVARLATIDVRIAEIDKTLKDKFPDYAALASPAPLSLENVQAELRANEALVLFLDTPEWKPTPEETFIGVVTKTDMRWVRSDLGTQALTREVAALRCGLDATAWDGDGSQRCAVALGIPHEKAPAPNSLLPFDHARAHALYKALLGEVEDLIKDKQLLVVPSGPLTQLPFQVLVTAPPPDSNHKTTAWLARKHAVTVLPAVSSLKALRRVAKPSAANKPMIGFGNPLLDGPDGRYAERAKLARETERCPDSRPQQVASLRGLRGGVVPVTTRGGLADLAHLKMQTPLPETADELCAVARDLGADTGEMRLGARASEREIKALSASGALAQYRIVHFATHGTLAGQLTGTTEPGLILTPPNEATSEDDGYLSASDIAALKLDADWIILSACNTAAAGATGAEALSGLARAFFYAQARALLVSHWEVYSDATVKLITSAVGAMTSDKSVGRAEALRRAMLALIDKGEPHEAHPAYWAPFVVVGEGAAGK